jgi:hypothetical protein
MELEADRAAGQAAAVLALRDTPRLSSAWDVFLASYVRWNPSRGYTAAKYGNSPVRELRALFCRRAGISRGALQ